MRFLLLFFFFHQASSDLMIPTYKVKSCLNGPSRRLSHQSGLQTSPRRYHLSTYAGDSCFPYSSATATSPPTSALSPTPLPFVTASPTSEPSSTASPPSFADSSRSAVSSPDSAYLSPRPIPSPAIRTFPLSSFEATPRCYLRHI